MQTTPVATTPPPALVKDTKATPYVAGTSLWTDAYHRFKRNHLAVISFFVILGYVIVALLAVTGLIFPDVAVVNNANTFAPFSWEHPFGTDVFGRDVLARAVHGTATALSVGLTASIIALVIGIVLGALAGYFGGKIDGVVTWMYTTVDSIPYILLIPCLVMVMGRGLTNVYFAVGLTSWVTLCRLIRAEFMKHKARDYVMAAGALGAGDFRKIFVHILPNVLHLAFVQFGLGFVAAIKIEVILSYIGVGVDPTTPSWGIMIDDAKLELARPFWGNLTAATVFMFGLILSFNLFNEGLRESLDPKFKNK